MSSADQASIFNGDQPTNPEVATTPVEPTSSPTQTQSEMVAALVGEGKKYKTVDDLAKAYINADDFIETLKAENRELKEKASATKTIDDVLERLKQQQSQPADKPADGGISPSDLAKLVEQTVTGLETKKQKESNLLKADAKMKEVFGEKAADKFNEVAATPDLKKVYMELAAADPDKFVALFTGGAKALPTGVDNGSVNTTPSYTASVNSRVNMVGTKEYFDNIRRTQPSIYYGSDFQLKMDNAVRNNPDLYYGKR